MREIHFYISNNKHHWQNVRPLVLQLKFDGVLTPRVISLCEFRRMETPSEELNSLDIRFTILADLRFRGVSTSSGRKHIGSNKSFRRNLLREVIWQFFVKRKFIYLNRSRPSLAIVPNDIAYPFDRICKWFSKRRINFLLLQEGIRFPLPNEMAELNYGMNGSKELLAWGHESAVYFRNLVPKTTRVIEAGNPRLDEQLMQDYMEDINSIRANVPLGTHNLLYVSNPVDDQGFCSYSQKLDLFRKFVIACREVCTETNTSILVRLHPREFENDFSTVIDELACGDWVVIVHGYPLFALLKVVDLTVILASTVGLESMACGVPVAVIKIPGFGFVHDYHRSGAAIGFDLEQPDEVAGLLRQTLKRPAEKANFVLEEYVDSHISNLGCSKEYICRRITELASN